MGTLYFKSFEAFVCGRDGSTTGNPLILSSLRRLGNITFSIPMLSLEEWTGTVNGVKIWDVFDGTAATPAINENYITISSLFQVGGIQALRYDNQGNNGYSNTGYIPGWVNYFFIGTQLFSEVFGISNEEIHNIYFELKTNYGTDPTLLFTYPESEVYAPIPILIDDIYQYRYRGTSILYSKDTGNSISVSGYLPAVPYCGLKRGSSGITSYDYVNNTYEYQIPVLINDGDVYYITSFGRPIDAGYRLDCVYMYTGSTTGNPATQIYNQSQNGLVNFWLNAPSEPPVPQPDDPFGPGGTSEPGGGGGTFDDTSDTIEDSSLPTLSVADTGFTTIYNPTLAQLQSLADYMWTSDSFLETIVNHAKQLLENPINAVIALNIVPCPVPDGGSQEVKVLFVPTGVTMTKAANQFVDVDCGTVRLDEYYGSAMDYSPLTEITCYLPYIGQVTLDTDEVMGNTLQVKYRIDIVTGMCVAKIFVSGNLLYQFSGHCAINMPITSADFSSYIGAIIQAAKLVGGAIAAGAGGAAAMATTDVPEATTTPALQPSPNAQSIAGMPEATESTPSKFGEVAKKTVMNTVDAVMGSKTVIEHSGGFSGNSGYLAVRRPYLIIKRPRMCNPNEYGAYNGYPSMMYLNLGTCSGYTEVQEIQLTGLSATNPELSEIAQLLKAGVIL